MRVPILLSAALLAGCAYNVTLMPRDSGRTLTGEMQGRGGVGTMTVNMGEMACTGPVARVASNQTFGFVNSFGTNSRGQTHSGFSTVATAGDTNLKSMLTCPDGSGLRCDLTGSGASGGGVCVDDHGRVYDALAVRK